MSIRSFALTAIATLTLTASAHATTFDFENASTTGPLTVTSNGVTATFSSVAGSAYGAQNTAGLLSFSYGLVDTNANPVADPLTITFSAPVSGSIDIPFAVLDFFDFGGPDSLLVSANDGQNLTFAATDLTTSPLGYPEGTADIVLNSSVTSLTLNSSNPDASLAIGDFSTVAPTPEPTSLVLLGTGLAGLLARRRRA